MNEETDIAIVGIGCMFPGAENLDEFWRVLVNGEDHVQDIPPERFNAQAFYDPDPDHPHKTYVRKAGLIQRYDEWDNRFFGISDKEAEVIDPQQHFVLESVHMALEDAGIPKEKIAGTNTGVYIGAMNHDWDCVLRSARHKSTNTTVTGTDSSILSARVAYFYNLLGPAITMNTACSSAMVAFHTASQALKNGEISMAIAGGVSFILDPEVFINLSSARMASPTGKCHTFSQDADGYARGEGCGIVLMKRLPDAVRDNNKIWGTLFTGLNQDGHMSSPITSPSGGQQEKLLHAIFEKCQIPPHHVQYLEAHGTGTSVGDFTEVSALGNFFSKHAFHDIPIGSVKSNIGHIESGAGAAALIKVFLMMKNQMLVPSINAEPLSPRIPFKELKLKVCQKQSSWCNQSNQNRRIAAINCFGFGGTNAHAVVMDYQKMENESTYQSLQTCLRFKKYVILSAEDLTALTNSARNMLKYLKNDMSLIDLSSTTIHSRSHYRFRKVFVVEGMQELTVEIEKFAQEKIPVKATGKDKPKMVFVYCGVGTTWQKMCKELITHDEIFKKSIRDIDYHLSFFANFSVEAIFENEEDVSDPLKNHLAIFACQVGLTQMWRHLGVVPDSIVGQSVGEVAAAYASNTITLKDAVKVIYLRSLNLSHESSGKMIVIQNCDVKIIEEKCKTLKNGQANIAVFHSPLSCAVSGDTAAIEELKIKLSDQPVKIIPLHVKCAYHSHLTRNASRKLEENLKGLTFNTPTTTVISTVTGKKADDNFGSPTYWAENVYKPVLFHHAIKETKEINENLIFLEIGPNAVLKAHLQNIFLNSDEEALPSMKRKSEIETFQKTFLDLFGKGIPVAWKHVVPQTNNNLPIPRYPFSKRKHLTTSENIRKLLNGYENNENNMLLSKVPGNKEQYKIIISKEKTPFVYHHIVDENTVVPGALYGQLALEIGNILIQGSKNFDLDVSWSIHRALLVKDDEISIVVKAQHESEQVISFEAFAEGATSPLSSGHVSLANPPRLSDTNVSRLVSILESDGDSYITYLALKEIGFHYGPMFQTIKRIAVRHKEIVCEVFIPDTVIKEAQRTYLHPVILDTMFQSCFGTRFRNNELFKEKILPIKVSHLIARQRPRQRMLCYTTLISDSATNASFDIILLQDSGSIIAEIRGFEVEKISSSDDIRSLSYYESWKVVDLQMELKFTESPSKKNICIFSWNAEYISLIGNAFCKRQEYVNVYQTLLTETSIPDLFSLENQTSLQNVSVIFAPGLTGLAENTTGDQLLESVSRITSGFLTLLKTLYKKNIHVIVVTNNTQPCCSGKVEVIGAELWGMVRAVTHEGTELSFTLLDIDRLSEFVASSLVHVSTIFEHDSRHVPREFAVRDNVIYKSELAKLPDAFHTRSFKSSVQTSQPVVISHYINQDKDRFFGLPFLAVSDPEKFVRVRPVETVLCNSLCASAFQSHSQLNPPSSKFPENEIKIFEVVGKARFGKNDIEVVASCHTVLKTELKIDRKTVFVKSNLKNYKAGYLHAAIISQAIAELIKKKTTVVVECSREYFTVYSFLRLLLKKRNCVVLFKEHSIGRRTQNGLATDIVMLSNRGNIEEAALQIQYPNVQRCISLKKPFQTQNGNGPVQFYTVDVADLYRPSCLRLASEKAYRFLVSVLPKYKEHDWHDNQQLLDVTEITKHLEIRTSEDFLIRGDSAYIVVGGLTGLGWLIIKYLSKRNAAKIISLSRRSPSSEAEQRILNVKNIHGVEILHREVDITNLKDLKNVIQSIQHKIPEIPIRGVFQGAGVLKDNTVPRMTQKEFELPLTVKVLGTWNLHLVTRNMDLDIFMMHSSVASVFGNYCQTNYAAANAFEDSFAHYRKSLGLPAQTINWGALDVGMGSDPGLRDIFFHKGINLMSDGQICKCLTQMLLSHRTQGIFVDFDIRRFLAANNLKWQNSKYTGIVPIDERLSSDIPKDKQNIDTEGNMTDLVKQVSAQVLLLDVSELTDTKTLAQFGLDSQNGIEIINTIYSRTKVRIPILMLLSSGFTIKELGDFIKEKRGCENADEKQNNGSDLNAESFRTENKFKCIKDTNADLVFQFKISAKMNKPEIWRKIMQIIIRMNSFLRVDKIKSSDTENSTEIITSVEDFILPFQLVHQKANQLPKRENNTLSVVYEDLHNQAILFVFGRRSHFDGFCGDILLRDLQKISEYICANQHVPSWFDKPSFDIVSLGSEKLLPVNNECKEYWKSRLLLCKTSSSLKAILPIIRDEPDQNAKISLPLIDVSRIEDFALKNGWTICSLVASAYQLILSQVTNTGRIPLIMEVDLRSQIPEFNEQIFPCSNFIPIISPSCGSSSSVQRFLSENNKIVKDGISHSLFPYSSIEELQEFAREIHHTHFFIFNVVHRDHQHINMISTEIERDRSFETMLQSRHDPRNHNLSLEIHFCRRRVPNYLASIIADYLCCLICSLPKISEMTLTHLHTRASLTDGGPVFLPPGPFFWKERDGTLQSGLITIKNRSPPSLIWATEHLHETELSNVKDVSMSKNKDFYELRFSVGGAKQSLMFLTRDLHVCRVWWAFLGNQPLPVQRKKSVITHPNPEENLIQKSVITHPNPEESLIQKTRL